MNSNQAFVSKVSRSMSFNKKGRLENGLLHAASVPAGKVRHDDNRKWDARHRGKAPVRIAHGHDAMNPLLRTHDRGRQPGHQQQEESQQDF
ncbi:MAG TPA: hypothetical protein P5186_07840 [Candidatus Paceibacterota bacterium]|nr:hypothetical protein [Verrucomicrobiota bacterium]HRY47940.1 hypothetical protein [Candidatus Paceibacterota bacterium]